MHRSFKLLAALLLVLLLQACASVQYQPLATIDRIAPQEGYRLRQAITRQQLPGNADDIFMVVMFSGGVRARRRWAMACWTNSAGSSSNGMARRTGCSTRWI